MKRFEAAADRASKGRTSRTPWSANACHSAAIRLNVHNSMLPNASLIMMGQRWTAILATLMGARITAGELTRGIFSEASPVAGSATARDG